MRNERRYSAGAWQRRGGCVWDKLISSFAFEDPQPFWLLAKLAVPAFSLIHPQGNTGKELTGHSSSQRHSAP